MATSTTTTTTTYYSYSYYYSHIRGLTAKAGYLGSQGIWSKLHMEYHTAYYCTPCVYQVRHRTPNRPHGQICPSTLTRPIILVCSIEAAPPHPSPQTFLYQYLKLGADSICSPHQKSIFPAVTRGTEVENSAESAQIAFASRSSRRPTCRLYAFYQRIPCVDVHTGILVTHAGSSRAR